MLITLAPEGGAGEGQTLRAALALSCATGQGFEMRGIGGGRARSGLTASQLSLVRTATLLARARVGSAFEGSADLRFEPGPVPPGEYRAELSGSEAATHTAQTFLPVLAMAGKSTLEVVGGTHLPGSPSVEFLGMHWAEALSPLGFDLRVDLVKAGFGASEPGELRAEAGPKRARTEPFLLEARGSLLEVRGVSGGARLRAQEAERQRDSAQSRLWEAKRIDTKWEVREVPAGSPGAFLFLEAVFENGRAAFASRTERRVRPEVLGDRTARELLAFLDSDACVDAHLADQLAVPIALSRCGGRVRTDAVSAHMRTIARVLTAFGVPASVSGRLGGPGYLEVSKT